MMLGGRNQQDVNGAGEARVPHRIGRLARRLAALLLVTLATPALADPYRLAEGDELRVVAADPAQISGIYTVGEGGAIVLPTIERLAVAGMTLDEVTASLRARLADQIAHPSIAVEIAKYRPFFILGEVANPGAFAYQPHLTLIGAVALAGGYRGQTDYLQSSVTAIRASESRALAHQQILESTVSKARIEAELAGAATFTMPRAGIDPDDVERVNALVKREQRVFETNRDTLARQTLLLKQEIQLRTEEAAGLEGRIKALTKEGDVINGQVAIIQGLYKKGLETATRMSELNRDASRHQGDVMQASVALSQARQGRNQADVQLASIQRDRRVRLLSEAQDEDSKIERLKRQSQADAAVMGKANAQIDGTERSRVITAYRIRQRGAPTVTTEDPNDAVTPGDTIEVVRTTLTLANAP